MNLKRTIGLLCLGLAAYALALGFAAPAARVIAWTDPPGVVIDDAGGSVWAGHARRVAIAGAPVPLNDVSWNVAAWRLITGELGGDVAAELAGLRARGYVAVAGDRSLRFADMTVRGPISGLLEQLPYPVAAAGSVLARVESGSLVDGVPRNVRGRAVWSDARLQAPLAVALGEVVAEFEPDGETQVVDVRARDGVVEIDGRITLEVDGRYEIELALEPTDRADSRVRDTLTLVGRPDAQGRYRIRQSGRLR